MAKRMDVGTSHHTPIKHAIMREFVGKERRAANAPLLHWVKRLYWIDLTAGNGATAYDAPWEDACSPGILAAQAARSKKPVIVDLYEKNPETYAALLENLTRQLPALGYQRTSENRWHSGNAEVRAWNWDGREAGTKHIHREDVTLVLNDPNSITEWAMDRRFTGRLEGMTKGVRTLSCLGFNVSGIKRSPFERDENAQATSSVSARSEWYGLIGSITDFLPNRHDLMLVAFARDAAQWAYLFSAPLKWREEEERLAADAFTATSEPHDYEFAWFRKDREKFARLCDRLILTKSELRERENPALPFELVKGEEDVA